MVRIPATDLEGTWNEINWGLCYAANYTIKAKDDDQISRSGCLCLCFWICCPICDTMVRAKDSKTPNKFYPTGCCGADESGSSGELSFKSADALDGGCCGRGKKKT